MAKGLEVCHKIDFTHTLRHPPFLSLVHFCLLSALGFITSPVNSSQYSGLLVLGSGGSSEGGRGVVLAVGEQLEFLGMAEEAAESSGVKAGQGEVMF